MKKQLWFTVVAVCLMLIGVNGTFAAEFGLKGGISASTVNLLHQPDQETQTMAGFQVGIFYNHKFSNRLSFQPELYYSMKGGKSYDIDSEGEGKWKMGYLELPILLKYKMTSGKGVVPTFFAGPYAALNLSARRIIVEALGDEDLDLDIKDEVKDMDFGFVFGLGLEIETGGGTLLLDARCNWGLIDVYDVRDYTGKKPELYHRQFVFMVGYRF